MASPILWRSEDSTVALIDVPRSIEAAQGLLDGPSRRHLLSLSPLKTPFPSNEPKSEVAKAKLEMNTTTVELHRDHAFILEHALEEVRSHHSGEWCLPRPHVKHDPLARGKKRKLETIDPTLSGTHAFTNDSEHEVMFESVHASEPSQFHIPPGSSFYLSDCADSKAFRDFLRSQHRDPKTRNTFDFVLLDPPWPNRSVKRTHQTPGSTYATSPSLAEIRELILDTKLDLLMAEDSLIAIWITNKSAVRELVLGEDGLFACWNVEVVEEWLWLKTTVQGEPVTPLHALWRKPYEVLLLGKKRQKDPSSLDADEKARKVMRRVLIGVPDLHSRKPCLKELIEPLMPDSKDYRALEVFARHLVAGWWSWGDECIKFNWDGYWQEESKS